MTPGHPVRRPAWSWWLLLLCWSLLGACAGLPPRPAAEPSLALRDDGRSTLGRIAAASRPGVAASAAGAADTADAAEASGFRLLPSGEFAFDARVALLRRAERSIDLQAYHVQPDHSGRALLRELRDAAARGVRVRLLLDDFHAAGVQGLLLGLAAHANVQVRLFNPLPLRSGAPLLRLLLSPGDFEQMNHRMHNKLLLVDGALALFGGRNIGDEYFMNHPEANFIDMDLLAAGPVVDELATVFDRYWNSEPAWPLHTLLPAAADAAAARAGFDAAVHDARPVLPDTPADRLGQTAVAAQLAAGRLQLVPAQAWVHADPPEKALDPGLLERPTEAMQGLLDAMATGRRYIALTSPYFVPDKVALGRLRFARQHGIRVVLVTNSLGSTDEPLVHEHYSRRRTEMLAMGIEIHEFSPAHIRRSAAVGRFGESLPRLHAKVGLVDDRLLLVGSVNLDARSAVGNTELGVVIDSPELTTTLRTMFTSSHLGRLYRLRLAADGQTVEWLATEPDGSTTVSREEPAATTWLRIKLWLQSLFVAERLL